MLGKILLINKGTALMLNRLSDILKSSDVKTVVVEPVINAIELERSNANILVLFTGDYIYDAAGLLSYLKELCFGAEKPLCVVGYDKEMKKLKETIPQSFIEREFIRPVDVKILASELLMLLGVEDEQKTQKNIVLVDDDDTFLQMMQNRLGTKYHVAAVCSGKEALEYLTDHTADLILLDYDMPGMSGPEVLEGLRSNSKFEHIPVIFLTGKNDRDSVVNVMNLKPEGYILKSMSSEEILASLSKFFRTMKIKETEEAEQNRTEQATS